MSNMKMGGSKTGSRPRGHLDGYCTHTPHSGHTRLGFKSQECPIARMMDSYGFISSPSPLHQFVPRFIWVLSTPLDSTCPSVPQTVGGLWSLSSIAFTTDRLLHSQDQTIQIGVVRNPSESTRSSWRRRLLIWAYRSQLGGRQKWLKTFSVLHQ